MTHVKTLNTLTLFLYLNSFKIAFTLKILSWKKYDVFLLLGKYPTRMATDRRPKYVWLITDVITSFTASYYIQFVNNT